MSDDFLSKVQARSLAGSADWEDPIADARSLLVTARMLTRERDEARARLREIYDLLSLNGKVNTYVVGQDAAPTAAALNRAISIAREFV